MAYDLAISPHGDLILGGNRDLAGVSGDNITVQRIAIRLVVRRGAWYFDEDETFGSTLHETLGQGSDQALEIDAKVRDALEPMDDISVEDVHYAFIEENKSIVVKVDYTDSGQIDEGIEYTTGALHSATVVVPDVIGEGGGTS